VTFADISAMHADVTFTYRRLKVLTFWFLYTLTEPRKPSHL